MLFNKLKEDIRAIIFFSLSLFWLMSLISYSPDDPSLNSLTSYDDILNYCGFIGAIIADISLQIFGMVSYLLVMLAFWQSIAQFRMRISNLNTKKKIICLSSSIVSLTGLSSNYFNSRSFYSSEILPGGILGVLSSEALISLFNPLGMYILLVTNLIVCYLFYFNIDSYNILKIAKLKSMLKDKYEEIKIKYFKKEKASPRKKILSQDNANWILPDLSELFQTSIQPKVKKTFDNRSRILIEKLRGFGINGTITKVSHGPIVSVFEFKPAADVKISKITDLADDLALAMSSESVRVIAPIPGKMLSELRVQTKNVE